MWMGKRWREWEEGCVGGEEEETKGGRKEIKVIMKPAPKYMINLRANKGLRALFHFITCQVKVKKLCVIMSSMVTRAVV